MKVGKKLIKNGEEILQKLFLISENIQFKQAINKILLWELSSHFLMIGC